MGKKGRAAASGSGAGAGRRRGRQGQYHVLCGNGDDDGEGGDAGAPPHRRGNRRRNGRPSPAAASDAALRAAIQDGGARAIVEVAADGNCLFRALADQLRFDRGAAHATIRGEVCDFLAAHADAFRHFLVLDDRDAPPGQEDAADFDDYLCKMRRDGEWGGHVELVAAAQLYRRGIVVFSSDLDAHRIECGDEEAGGGGGKSAVPDMMVSYHDKDHYNSVRDCRMTKPLSVTKLAYATVAADQKGDSDSEEKASDAPHKALDGADADQNEPGNHDASTAPDGGAIGKNATCPCGSGKRYKKCCLAKKKQATRLRARQAAADRAAAPCATSEPLVPSDEERLEDKAIPAPNDESVSQQHGLNGNNETTDIGGAFRVMVL